MVSFARLQNRTYFMVLGVLLAGKLKNKHFMCPSLWFRTEEMAPTQKLRPESCNSALKGKILRDHFPSSGTLSLNCIGLLPGKESLILDKLVF